MGECSISYPLPSGHGHNVTDLECWNLLVALKVWGPQFCGRCIILKCDNITVVQVFNSDSTRSRFLAAVLQNVWLVCAIHNIELKVVHVAGITNVIADLVSH